MRLELPDPPFTRSALSEVFGFAVPQAFVDALNVLCEGCATAESAYRRVDERLGWLLADEDQRYSATPPELFPFAGTGMDGGHFGFVIHAPERVESDYPVARYEPMDSDPVRRVGRTTAEAFANELSSALFPTWQPESDWPPPLPAETSRRLAAVGIVPAQARSFSSAAEYGYGTGVAPGNIPIGWRYVASTDGIGVLAPANAFDATCAHLVIERPMIADVISGAQAALAAGTLATALWYAREGLWRECHQPTDENLALSQAAIAAYQALGRPQLARVVERRLARDFKGR